MALLKNNEIELWGWWDSRDSGDGKSQLENEGFSLRAAVAGGFTYMAESHFRHLCTCESAFVCVWRETGSEQREEQEGARERELHGNSCSNTKLSLLAHYPRFVCLHQSLWQSWLPSSVIFKILRSFFLQVFWTLNTVCTLLAFVENIALTLWNYWLLITECATCVALSE